MCESVIEIVTNILESFGVKLISLMFISWSKYEDYPWDVFDLIRSRELYRNVVRNEILFGFLSKQDGCVEYRSKISQCYEWRISSNETFQYISDQFYDNNKE